MLAQQDQAFKLSGPVRHLAEAVVNEDVGFVNHDEDRVVQFSK